MNVVVVTLFPELVAAVGESGIPRVAVESGALALTMISPRDFATNRHRTVDDRPFGGGPGMLLMAETLANAIESAKQSLPAEVLGQRLSTCRRKVSAWIGVRSSRFRCRRI